MISKVYLKSVSLSNRAFHVGGRHFFARFIRRKPCHFPDPCLKGANRQIFPNLFPCPDGSLSFCDSRMEGNTDFFLLSVFLSIRES